MQSLRFAIGIAALMVLSVGPIALLALWRLRASRLPSLTKYTLVSMVGVTACFWMLFMLSEYILELQFRAIVPLGEWTLAQEALWTPAQHRVVEAYFGDGGRNVFALFAPSLLLPYSFVVWLVARSLDADRRRHRPNS